MTFFGYDVKNVRNISLGKRFEEICVRYVVSKDLLEMFSETKMETLPVDLFKLPYPCIFIETNDKLSDECAVVGIIAFNNDFIDNVGTDYGDDKRNRLVEVYPLYKINGTISMPVGFIVRSRPGSSSIVDVDCDWSTPTKDPMDVGLHEEHPLVKRASLYCWAIAAITSIYVTSNDADIILGINTKEYKKLIKKKKTKTGKINQLRNTRYLGNKIKIDRKINTRKTPGGGTHASPCPHWRSGHFRHLGGGKIVWVKPCIIGFGKEKQIPEFKKYIVE
jgi:hypothetical protein